MLFAHSYCTVNLRNKHQHSTSVCNLLTVKVSALEVTITSMMSKTYTLAASDYSFERTVLSIATYTM